MSSEDSWFAIDKDLTWLWRRLSAYLPGQMERVPPSPGLADEATTIGDVRRAFRRRLMAQRAHPDLGGTAEAFRRLVQERDEALAHLCRCRGEANGA